MLRIAVCDDEEKQLEQVSALLETYLEAHPDRQGQVETFQSGSALLERVKELRGFDLYILDILMPSLSGIEIGRRLRALADEGEIIYLTNSNDFAADSYDVRAFFYLLKPVEKSKLFQVLDKAVERRNWRQSSAVVAVSYTHLDVYKRQVPGAGERGGLPPAGDPGPFEALLQKLGQKHDRGAGGRGVAVR